MERALDDALESWRRRPSAELADDIDRLSQAITAGRPAVAQDKWELLFERKRAADLGALLAALPPTSSPRLHHRLDRLFFWARDPRITEELRRLLMQEAPSATRHDFWRRILALVAWTGDERAALWLNDALLSAQGTAIQMRWLIQRTNEVITALGGRARAPRLTVVQELRVAVPAIAPTRRGATEDLVWADCLLEGGDPRGELLMLQSLESRRRDQRRRIGELLRHHGRAWLGRLSAALKPEGLIFERGYVVAGRLSGARALRELTGAAEWSTVRTLDLRALGHAAADAAALGRFLEHPVMGNLVALTHFPAAALRVLPQACGALEQLEITGLTTKEQVERLRRALPRLESLRLNGASV